MTTVANCGLSLQITRQLVNSSTRTLVNLTKWGYPAFHAPPYGGGVGGGAFFPSFFLQQALSKYCVLYILLVFEYKTGNNGAEQGC